MNKKNSNIDKYTDRLIKQGGKVEPSADFTQKVMSQIVKDPAVKFNFSIIKDDKESRIWLFISIASMFVGYFLFFFFKNGFNLEKSVDSFSSALYFQSLSDLFSQIYYELSFSPYVFIGLAGVLLLVLIDKTLIKLFHSI